MDYDHRFADHDHEIVSGPVLLRQAHIGTIPVFSGPEIKNKNKGPLQ